MKSVYFRFTNLINISVLCVFRLIDTVVIKGEKDALLV